MRIGSGIPSPKARVRRFMLLHWHGRSSITRSFGLCFAVPWLLAMLALGGLALRVHGLGESLRAGSLALLVGWPLAAAVLCWGAIGAWRSARARIAQRKHRRRAWGWVTQAALITGVSLALAGGVFGLGPHLGETVALAAGNDPLGRLTATPSPDGRRLRLAGAIGLGDGERIAERLHAMPELRLIELDVAGARVTEARHLAEAVSARRLQTRVVGACDNACALVFMAGQGRQVMPGGGLSFHRVTPASINPLYIELARHEQAALYRAAGLPEIFITKMLATPPGLLWRPEPDELLSAGLVGVPGRPLDIVLPDATGTALGDYMDALRSHGLWPSLDARYAGALQVAAERMWSARSAGASDDATQIAGQRVIEALLPRLVSDAGPGQWDSYATLLAEQVKAANNLAPTVCQGVLAGDAEARRSLPAPLVQREADWLASVLIGPPPDTPTRKPNPLEREVMRRTLGEGAAGRLSGLWGPARREMPCAQAAALMAEVRALPPAEQRLALRFLFGPR